MDSFPSIYHYPKKLSKDDLINVISIIHFSKKILQNNELAYFHDKKIQSTFYVSQIGEFLYFVVLYSGKKEKNIYSALISEIVKILKGYQVINAKLLYFLTSFSLLSLIIISFLICCSYLDPHPNSHISCKNFFLSSISSITRKLIIQLHIVTSSKISFLGSFSLLLIGTTDSV